MKKAIRIAIAGMFVSGCLGAIKIVAGLKGHSASVLADGLESACDVLASGMVLVGLILSARPADENHPYGHGRVETLTGLLLGLFLFNTGLFIAWRGLAGLSDVSHVPEPWTVYPLILSILAKGVLMFFKRRHARSIGSSALMADATNDGLDTLSGFVALLCLSLALWRPGQLGKADHYGAFLVGLIVSVTSLRVVLEDSLHLMDTMPDDAAMSRIREVAMSVDGALGVEKCFARKTGMRYHADLHLEVAPEITVRESHEIAQRVRMRVREQVPWVADVLVHVEPWPGK